MKIYIGYDAREDAAYEAAVKTLRRFSAIRPEPLVIERLSSNGLISRNVDKRGPWYDMASNAPVSTDFAISRFLVPILCQSGWALFVDCDMLFYADPLELMEYADQSKAVMVVKHHHEGSGIKMDGQIQSAYPRKNWSSVMLFNCDHHANRRLTIHDINTRPGRDLHGFYWLADEEIGELPQEWNWLVGVQQQPENVKIAHFTLGGPWIPEWKVSEYDSLWLEAAHD